MRWSMLNGNEGVVYIMKKFLSAIVLSFAMSFMLFIYAPFELYFTNKEEFWFEAVDLIPVSGVLFAGLFCASLLGFFICAKIHEKLFRVAYILYAIAFFCTYVQGNYLIGKLPPLDGTVVNWSEYSQQRIWCLILWAAVIVLAIVLLFILKYQKFERVAAAGGVLISLMLLSTLVVVGVSEDGFAKKSNLLITTHGELDMSKEQNFVILVLDAVESNAFKEVLAAKPQYEEVFRDFTYFDNTLGAYPFTDRSIPYILSGEWFENEEPFEDYNYRSFYEAEFLTGLRNMGYRIGAYDEQIPLVEGAEELFDNIMYCPDLHYRSLLKMCILETRFIGFCYAPFDLKRFCVIPTYWWDGERAWSGDFRALWFGGSTISLQEESMENGVTLTDQKCFRFIHVDGAHVPFDLRVEEDGRIVTSSQETTYADEVEACLASAKSYLEALKEADVYDNTAIVILADHGYNDMRYEPSEGMESAYGRQNPILLIKGFGEKGDAMRTSKAPISYEDLQGAYSRLLDGAQSADVFEWKEDDERERRFLWFMYNHEDHMAEYLTNGYSDDTLAMRPTGNVYDR